MLVKLSVHPVCLAMKSIFPHFHRPAGGTTDFIHRGRRHPPGQTGSRFHALQQFNQKGQGTALWDMVSLMTDGCWEEWTL